jgi:hypothetical protein
LNNSNVRRLEPSEGTKPPGVYANPFGIGFENAQGIEAVSFFAAGKKDTSG